MNPLVGSMGESERHSQIGERMLTATQQREITDLVNALSGSLLVDHNLIVEAIRENDDIYSLIHTWLTRGGIDYATIVQAFGEVF